MPLPLANGEVDVWLVPLGADGDSPEAASLSTEERWRARRFHHERDRRRFVAAHAGVRAVLARYLDRPPAALRFARGAWGKPLLDPPEIEFSLAHSGELAIVAVARERPVGVDIERLRAVPDVERLARSFFSVRERDELAALEPARREGAFLRGWTRKEAVVKGTGVGLSLSLASFDVPLSAKEGSVLVPRDGARSERWSVRALDVPPGYVASLAVSGAPAPVRYRGSA